MKELILEDFNLTPEELARLVAGAQRHFPGEDDEAPEQNIVDNSDVQPTSS